MNLQKLTLIAVLGLLTAACAPAASQAVDPLPVVDVPVAQESDPLPEGNSAETNEINDGEPDSGENEVEEELTSDPYFLPDDRPVQLRALTSTWNTNWERRTIEYDEILSGGPPRDGIPSVDEPQFVDFAAADGWLQGNEPVVSLEINGDARAYPLQIMTWHEIANDTVGDVPVAITFCPLCNSAIVFDRRFGDQVFEFGTSGLLRKSDLIMYDRTTETLWQQFTGEGIVGELAGEQLDFLASSLISYDGFKAAHPQGQVMSRDTGFDRRYGNNPYVGYDDVDNNPFLFQGPTDGRLPAMERVVTVHLDEADVDLAYPLSTLFEVGVITDSQAGVDLVVFHLPGTASALDASSIAASADVGATGVFSPHAGDQTLTFRREGDGFVDDQTGSQWNIVGRAVSGDLEGTQLDQIVSADHFWFSWAAFRPDTIIYAPQAS